MNGRRVTAVPQREHYVVIDGKLITVWREG
jgi:hypothetical protein